MPETSELDPITNLPIKKKEGWDFDALLKTAREKVAATEALGAGNIGAVGIYERDEVKPEEYDFTLVEGQDWNEIRAEMQGAGTRWAHAGLRLIPDLLLETVESVGYLGSFIANNAYDLNPEAVDNVVHNSLSQWAKEHQEELHKWAPIYRTKESQDFGWHSMLDSGFWTEDAIPLISTVLSLMIPAAGAGRLASLGVKASAKALGKGIRTATLANKTAKKIQGLERLQASRMANFANASTAAVVSRTAEGAMESLETYHATYAEAISSGIDHEEALKKAADSASETYKLNYLLTLIDFFQFKAILGGFNKSQSAWAKAAREANKGEKLNKLQKAGKIFSNSKQMFAQMGSESFEEVFQLASGEYARDRALGKVEGVDLGFNQILERMIKSMGTDEGMKSAVLGAMGGGFFQAVGSMANKKESNKSRIEMLNRLDLRQKENFAILENIKAKSAAKGDQLMYEKAHHDQVAQLLWSKFEKGEGGELNDVTR